MKHADTGLSEAEKELADAVQALEAASRRHRLAKRMLEAWRTLKREAYAKEISDDG